MAPATRLVVVTASRQVHDTAARSGCLAELGAAGARLVERSHDTRASLPAGSGIVLTYGVGDGAPADLALAERAGIEACGAAALAGEIADPRLLHSGASDAEAEHRDAPASYVVDPFGLVRPSNERDGIEVMRGAHLAPHPIGRPIEGPLRGVVLLELPDHVTTDQIVARGARLEALATDVPALAELTFAGLDRSFARRAAAQDGGFLVAGADLGGGERRPQAVLVVVALGVRAVLARSFAVGFRGELIAHGVLPLCFGSETDAATIQQGDELEIPSVPEGLAPHKPVVVRNLTGGAQLTLRHDLTAREIDRVRAGGLLRAHMTDRAAA